MALSHTSSHTLSTPLRRAGRAVLALATIVVLAGCPGPAQTRGAASGADRTGAGASGGAGAGAGAGAKATPTPAPTTPAAILAASDLPAVQDSPLPGDPMGVTVHRLSNGLTVYISTDRQKPRFSAWIAVRAGSRDDPHDSTGLAHYLEHMLFKGSQQFGTTNFAREQPTLQRIAQLYDQLRTAGTPAERTKILGEIDAETQKDAAFAIPNEIDQLYAKLGIEGLNAFTSDEQTVYTCDVPSNRLEQWATIEGDRFQNAQFRQFWPELEAVYEEKNRTLDNPAERVSEALALALFPRHPYGTQTTIGTVENLKTPAYGDMVRFFQRWYAPNNVAILLAGDIDAEHALPVLEKAFGSWKPKALEPAPPGSIVPLHGRTQVDVVAPGEQSVEMAWQTVPLGSPDRVPLEVMDLLVDNSVSGLLNLDLVLTQKVPSAGSFPRFYNEAGLWAVRATARDGQGLDEVEKLLRGEVAKLKAGAFTQADLDAIILNQEVGDKEQLESNEARVARMAEAWIGHLPWSVEAGHIAAMRKVTRADVIRVANRYLGDSFVVVRRVRGTFEPPKIKKPAITPIKLDTKRESALARKVLAMQVVPLEPVWLVEGKDYQRLKLPSGELVASHNGRHDLFTVTYDYRLGEQARPLLCHALELLDRSGAKGMSAVELKRKLFAMATTISTRCDQRDTQIYLSGIDRNLEASVALLDTWLRTAQFDDKTVAALAENRISQRNDQMQEPPVIAAALADWVDYGADSSFLTVPSNRQLKAATGRVLGKLLAQLPDYRHRTTYFGPRAAADAAKVVVLGRHFRAVPPRRPVRYRRSKGTLIYEVPRAVAQSQVRIAVAKPPIGRAERPVANLYSQYVGGNMGSVVFQEIRETRGLAYSVWAFYKTGQYTRDQSALIAGMGTQSDKTITAVSTLLGLLRTLPISEQRLATARQALDEQYRSSRVDPRQAPLWVLQWEDRGEKTDPRPREWAAFKELSQSDLAAFAKKVASGPTLIAILGDTARFDQAALKKLGTPRVVKADKLFGY